MDPQALRALGQCAAERPVVRGHRLHDTVEHALLAALAIIIAVLACKGIGVALSVIFAATAGAL